MASTRKTTMITMLTGIFLCFSEPLLLLNENPHFHSPIIHFIIAHNGILDNERSKLCIQKGLTKDYPS